MIIKKFIAKTEEEATQDARKELGDGIVVMNVKSVKAKGIFSFLKSKLMEVTVALEEEREKFSPIVKKEEATFTSSIAKEKVEPRKSEVDTSLSEEAKSIEQKLEKLQNLLVSTITPPPEEEVVAEEMVVKEIEEEKDSELTKFMKLLYHTMLDNEVDEKYANIIMDETDKVQKPNMPFDYALANTYQRMILKFGKTAGIVPTEEGPKVVLFIGPTGVGKTTTIAKIASKFSVE